MPLTEQYSKITFTVPSEVEKIVVTRVVSVSTFATINALCISKALQHSHSYISGEYSKACPYGVVNIRNLFICVGGG